jgi:hypothetical protein
MKKVMKYKITTVNKFSLSCFGQIFSKFTMNPQRKLTDIALWFLLVYRLFIWGFLEIPLFLDWPLKTNQSCSTCRSFLCAFNCELRRVTGFTNFFTWYLESGTDPIIAAGGLRMKVNFLFINFFGRLHFYIVVLIFLADCNVFLHRGFYTILCCDASRVKKKKTMDPCS